MTNKIFVNNHLMFAMPAMVQRVQDYCDEQMLSSLFVSWNVSAESVDAVISHPNGMKVLLDTCIRHPTVYEERAGISHGTHILRRAGVDDPDATVVQPDDRSNDQC